MERESDQPPGPGPSGRRWSSEALLEAGSWRARHDSGASSHGGTSEGEAAPLEFAPYVSPRERLRRAVSVPALAGGAVFVVAVLIAISMTVLQSHAAPADGPVDAANGGGATGNVGTHDLPADADGDTGGSGAASGETAPAGSGGSPIAARPSATVFAHVVGEVRDPGVVELAPGGRVADAIKAAGGASKGAALEAVNLARKVVDGEQIVVPDAAGAAELKARGPSGSAEAGGPALGAASAPDGQGSTDLVALNTADAAALDTLPGVGPALAQRILEWREQNGGFTSIDQLTEVSGIGPKTFERLSTLVII